MPTTFLQEIVAIAPETKKYYQLSDINKRLVCYPDVSSLLVTSEQRDLQPDMDDR